VDDGRLSPTLASFAPTVTNKQLLKWMFKFLRPVKFQAAVACMWVAAFIGAEVLAVKYTGQAIGQIQHLHGTGTDEDAGFWAWITGSHVDASALR